MACPNFKNRQKNGLGPLEVKVFKILGTCNRSDYVCYKKIKELKN
jgi:hypothetical protein